MENKVDMLFYARSSKKSKRGLTPIYARLVVNGERLDFSTGFSINKTLWNREGTKVIGNTQEAQLINNYISTKKLETQRAYNELLLEQKPVSLHAIKNKLFGVKEEENHKTLLQLVDFHNGIFQSKIGTDTAHSTYRKYKVTRKRLVKFIAYQYKKQDILLKDLKLEFIVNFDLYLKTVFKNSHNTVVKHCKNLKAIINMGIQYQWLESSPFIRHKTPYKEGNKAILSTQELQVITEKEIPIDRLSTVRDLFLFQCYTGLAFSDMQELKKTHIQIGIDGNFWIMKPRQKNQQRSSIPILTPAISILDKYDWKTKDSEAFLLPRISNQKMNGYLNELMVICGITKKVSSHVGRRTFATTVTLTNGVPIETVSRMLGHTNLVTTQIYAKVVDTKISQDMQKVKDKLSSNLKTGTDDNI